MSADPNASPLPPVTIRNLSDPKVEPRKKGGIEVEQIVKGLKQDKNDNQIRAIISFLSKNFTESPQPSQRKGGLFGLAAAALALHERLDHAYMQLLLRPVLGCFSDNDWGVRFNACETMYNIAKVARYHILPFFGGVFQGLIQLSADTEPKVQNAAQTLDRLVKDIATEAEDFNVDQFIQIAKGHMNTTNPYIRQFLVGWLSALDQVPDLNLLDHLPEFLDALFTMLSDRNKEIVNATETLLNEFQRQVTGGDVKRAPSKELVQILLNHCDSRDEKMRRAALDWIKKLLQNHPKEMVPFSASAIKAILPCMSVCTEEIRAKALACNTILQGIIKIHCPSNDESNLDTVITILQDMLLRQEVQSRIAALQWMLMLLDHSYDLLESKFNNLFPLLLKTLSDANSSEAAISLDLAVLAKLSRSPATFQQFLEQFVRLLSKDRKKLMTVSALGHIIKQLSSLINPEKLFRRLAAILREEQDQEFVHTVVTILNHIMMTAAELRPLRTRLKKGLQHSKSKSLFVELYYCWSYNAVSALSLCLLSMAYEHAHCLVCTFVEVEVSIGMLTQIDKLVHLFESAVYAHVRLHLLEPQSHPYLVKTLYGVLALLPQTTAYDLLKNRLKSVQPMCLTNSMMVGVNPADKKAKEGAATVDVDWSELELHFRKAQNLGKEKPVEGSSDEEP